MGTEPLVSIVTPFHNGAAYIAECIESVLAQVYRNFEHLLVDNCSTDGAREIAARYAAKDRRIRLIVNSDFLPQLSNFNAALAHIAPGAKYVKMALADDTLLPECVERMVSSAESCPTAGLVGSYYHFQGRIDGVGLPRDVTIVKGVEALRLTLRSGCFLVGSPTSLLYRADLVRARQQFFQVGSYHADTNVAYDLMLEHDFAFVHQVLSFIRSDNESLSNSIRAFGPNALDFLIVVERLADRVLPADEAARCKRTSWRDYHAFLGRELLRFRGEKFWSYHRAGLATIERSLQWRGIVLWALRHLFRAALNPGNTISKSLASLRRAGT